jgi:hypothetical protein
VEDKNRIPVSPEGRFDSLKEESTGKTAGSMATLPKSARLNFAVDFFIYLCGDKNFGTQ